MSNNLERRTRNLCNMLSKDIIAILIAFLLKSALACDFETSIESGKICGARRLAADGSTAYASFRGVPYAEQPVGELRFQELQPAQPWQDTLNATSEGPICPQYDIFFRRLMKPQGMSEACIHANIHVPEDAFNNKGEQGLPILVFVHGGDFQYGSGDSDVYGPENLVMNNIVVITFNYRLNVFGFLTLNSTSIPGNNGLRDAVTLLRWVKRNAAAFGGDPDNVTLGGHSSGAVSTQMLTLSNATSGLFKRAIIMSGISTLGRYNYETSYGLKMSQMYVSALGINYTDPEDIHRELVRTPLDTIMKVHKEIMDKTATGVLNPFIESSFEGITRIIQEEPNLSLAKGIGNDIPVIIGCTNNEMESFRPRFEETDIVSQVTKNPSMIIPPRLTNLNDERKQVMTAQIWDNYLGVSLNMQKYIDYFSNTVIIRPSIKTAKWRAVLNYAPTYLYQFSYSSNNSSLRQALGFDYQGAAHAEDLTYVFRANSIVGSNITFPPNTEGDLMNVWMTNFVANFVKCGNPTCSSGTEWPPVDRQNVQYQAIRTPDVYDFVEPSQEQKDMIQYFDTIEDLLLL